MQTIRHFLLAVQFFTRIPITGPLARWVGYSPQMLRDSAAHFAGVGWIVGIAAALVYGALAHSIASSYAPLVAAVLCTVASVLLTGGFHEDGLADVADGLGGTYGGDYGGEHGSEAGATQRLRALEIMKDSRVGAFGALALVLALLAKVALLAALADTNAGAGEGAGAGAGDIELLGVCVLIVCAHVVSRACPMVLVRCMAHVGDAASSKSKPLADQISWGALGANLVWCLALLPLVFMAQLAPIFIAACACSVLALAYMWHLFSRRLQGFTGDCLGATQQVCEIAFYLAAACML